MPSQAPRSPISPTAKMRRPLPVAGPLFAVIFLVPAFLIFAHIFESSMRSSARTSMRLPSLPLAYPKTRTTNDSDTIFGVKVADPYRWLEDGDSPEVQSWTEAENKLTRSYLDALPGRAALEKRYRELLYIDTISTPQRAGDRFFYMKRQGHHEKAILYWRDANDPAAPEHVLVDLNPLIAKDNTSLGTWVPTLDGKLLAYTLKPNNGDEATLYVKDVETGADLPGEVIEGAKYADPSWMPDGSGFVYTYLPPGDPAQPQERPGLAVVRYHKLGTDPKKDPVIHPKTGDATKFIGAFISRDGKWIFFEQHNGWDKNDLYYQSLHGQPTAALADNWDPIVVGKDFNYALYPWKGQAYILTNEDAPHFRIFKVGLDNPVRAKWHEIVPESPSIVIQGMTVVGDHLVLDKLDMVTSRVEIRDLDGKPIRRLVLPGLGSISELEGEPDRDDLYFGFENFTQPLEIYHTSISNPAETLYAKLDVPVNPAPYTVDQKFFLSKDGTKIPMFIVCRKDILLDGGTPFVIYGYGGFGLSQTPFFWPGAYPWLEAGGGFAVVNLRGGGEFGEHWHQDGMLLKKQNVFDDCAGAAQYLIDHGYTKADRLAVRGASNGGLLVGAMITQHPELFRAAVCEVPLLDMIRYDKFSSGKTWVPEYGTVSDPAQFRALYAYSPYHHVKAVSYPSVLFCTATDDDRVDPMHARKMTAAMQAATTSSHPIVLRVEKESGHGGGDQVSKMVALGTDIWGFLIHELGAKPPQEAQNKNASR